MSVFRGADLVPPAYPDREAFMLSHAPVRYFVNRLQLLRGSGGGSVREVNVAVGGSFDNDVPRQYAEAGGKPYDLVFLGLAMNSGTVYGVHGRGPNAAYTYDVLRGFIRQLQQAGARPILCNTIHPWPERISPESMASSLVEGIAWPPEQATLFTTTMLSFDAEAGLIAAPPGLLTSGPGRLVKEGSLLRINRGGGANQGRTLTVTRVVENDVLALTPGDITQSGQFEVQLQHYAPPIDEILVPPPVMQRERRDWTGNGIPVDGLASFRLWNGMLGDLARETGTLLLDLEWRGFRWVERNGWPSIYRTESSGGVFETLNHPQLAAQRSIYGGLMEYLAEQLHERRLTNGHAVLRGPDPAL